MDNSLTQNIVYGLKTNVFKSDLIEFDKISEWGIASEFRIHNLGLLYQFLSKKIVDKVIKLEKKRKYDDQAYPQLRIQCKDGIFYVRLQSYLGKYDNPKYQGKLNKLVEFPETEITKLIDWLLSNNFVIYDQDGDNVTKYFS